MNNIISKSNEYDKDYKTVLGYFLENAKNSWLTNNNIKKPINICRNIIIL